MMYRKEMELYIHIPFCVRKCNYCDFLSFPADEDMQEEYVKALLREIIYYGSKCSAYTVTTVYIGGGTPSWLREELMERILRAVHAEFHLAEDAEVSIECNPGTVTDRKFAAYKAAGINRISIGLQSADDNELKMLGRLHTFDQFVKTYELARKNGFQNINVDLINGLPNQTVENYCATLQQVLRLKPEHISVYSLMIEKGTPFYDLYKFDAVRLEAGMEPIELPSGENAYRMTKITEQVLKKAGYKHYEISNFAKPGYECRHNIGYWERANYLGLGIGAASLMENIRYTNVNDIYAYMEGTRVLREGNWRNEVTEETRNGIQTYIDEFPATNLHVSAERIGLKAQIEEFMFLGLRMIEGVSRDKFAYLFGKPIEVVYQDVFVRLQEEELLVKRAGRIYLTERGQDVSNYVLSQFLLT